MCQRLYIATRKKLPTIRKTKSAPFLEVVEVQDIRARRRFGADRPFLYLAAAHVECGCGFPAVSTESDSLPPRVDDADIRSMHAVAIHLREACRGDSTAELYLCWAHELDDPPASRA